MQSKYVVMFLHQGREVRLYTDDLQGALATARSLSANTDIEESTLYKLRPTQGNRPVLVTLLNCRLGAIATIYPAGERALKQQ